MKRDKIKANAEYGKTTEPVSAYPSDVDPAYAMVINIERKIGALTAEITELRLSILNPRTQEVRHIHEAPKPPRSITPGIYSANSTGSQFNHYRVENRGEFQVTIYICQWCGEEFESEINRNDHEWDNDLCLSMVTKSKEVQVMTEHNCRDCLKNGGIGFECSHLPPDSEVPYIADNCEWCIDHGYIPGQSIGV